MTTSSAEASLIGARNSFRRCCGGGDLRNKSRAHCIVGRLAKQRTPKLNDGHEKALGNTPEDPRRGGITNAAALLRQRLIEWGAGEHPGEAGGRFTANGYSRPRWWRIRRRLLGTPRSGRSDHCCIADAFFKHFYVRLHNLDRVTGECDCEKTAFFRGRRQERISKDEFHVGVI